MKRHLLHRAVVITGMLFAFPFQDASAQADQIRYSWSGQLVPDGSGDPWQLGEQGKPFLLDVVASLDAIDLLDVNVEFAAFQALSARLALDGNEIAYVSGANLDFTDNWSGLRDLLVFHGEFERLGHTIEIGSLVALPLSIFQFSQTVESPPFFGSTSASDGGTCCGGIYTAIVAPGTLVSVVPEPASVLIFVAIVSICVLGHRTRYAYKSIV